MSLKRIKRIVLIFATIASDEKNQFRLFILITVKDHNSHRNSTISNVLITVRTCITEQEFISFEYDSDLTTRSSQF